MTALRIGSLRQSKVKEKTVIQQLRAASDDESITELYFWKIEFSQRVVDELWKVFARDYRIWNSIKVLHCTGNVDAVVRTIFHYECVLSLVLSGAETSPEALEAVNRGLEGNGSIQTIRLRSVHFAENCGHFEGLKQNNSLLELDLTGSHFSHGAVTQLADALGDNVGLECVTFDQCFFNDGEMTEIIDSIYDHPTIQHLNFGQNSAHSRALEAIADLLESEECALTSLNLSSQVLGEKEMLDMTCLGRAVFALQSNTSLRSLDISGNNFPDDAVLALSTCLIVNSNLRTLNVNDSHISEEGIKLFAKNVPNFKGLKVLNIAGNEVTENAAECLVKGLGYNRVLESLGPIEECAQQSHLIEHFLDLNMAGRRAMQIDIPLAVWPNLLARAGHMHMPVMDNDDNENGLARSGRNENVLYALLRGAALFER